MTDTTGTEPTTKNAASNKSWRSKRRATEFAPTTTSTLILDALAYLLKKDDFGVIYGGPGVGKTRTVQHFREQIEDAKAGHVWVTTISPSISTVVPMLSAIASTVGVVSHESGARNLHSAICSRLTSARRSLLVVDEAQHLKANALEELRALHDATGAAIAIVGNDGVYKRLAAHPQIHSRVGLRLAIPRPREADVEELVRARWGDVDDDTMALLDQIAALPGALRLVVKVMDAAGSKRTDVRAVRTACKMLGVDLGGA